MSFPLILGFIFGILSALFFAFYMVPQKLVRQNTPTFLWWMSLGVLITSLIPYIVVGCPLHADWPQRGMAILCGIIWGLGTMSFAAGIARIGLAQATPIKNTTGVLGTLVGLIAFAEWKTTEPISCLLGSVAIVLAAILIGATGREDTTRRSSFTGVLFALGAAVCYASYLYPLKQVVTAIGYWEFAPWMAIGILFTACGAVLLTRGSLHETFTQRPNAVLGAMLGGASWTIALFCLAASMDYANLAIAWSLAQLNTVPAVFIGMYLFGEVHWGMHWRKITLGLLVAIVGTLLLGFSKHPDVRNNSLNHKTPAIIKQPIHR